MNILVIGSGGREHAFCWKIAQSEKIDNLYCAPGNAGTAIHGTNVDINLNSFDEVEKFAIDNNINMIVVGPEAPLVNGIHDHFIKKGLTDKIAIIGPEKKAAMLEGSKDFAKEFMIKHNIPTAQYKSFTSNTLKEGISYLESKEPPYVLKADGLAAGKGVLICSSLEEAKKELEEMLLYRKFGDASNTVVIEDFLTGIELSIFVLTDGQDYVILPEAKDYKRIGENDTGLNTGGMGSISPVPFAKPEFLNKVEEHIIKPTINGLNKDNILYKGFIFFGLINMNGNPYVIEYNVRMGDPEAESVIPRIKSDIVDLFEGVANNDIKTKDIEFDPRFSTAIMLVSGGYPGSYEKGKEINGLEDVIGSIIFHAGTKQENGKIVSNGGRVLAITSLSDDMESALDTSYMNAAKVKFDKVYYRKDLGKDLMK